MATGEFRFICGLVAGGCIIAAIWLRLGDPLAWVLDQLSEMGEDLTNMNGIINAFVGICAGTIIAIIATSVLIAAIETLAAVLRK